MDAPTGGGRKGHYVNTTASAWFWNFAFALSKGNFSRHYELHHYLLEVKYLSVNELFDHYL